MLGGAAIGAFVGDIFWGREHFIDMYGSVENGDWMYAYTTEFTGHDRGGLVEDALGNSMINDLYSFTDTTDIYLQLTNGALFPWDSTTFSGEISEEAIGGYMEIVNDLNGSIEQNIIYDGAGWGAGLGAGGGLGADYLKKRLKRERKEDNKY